MWGGCSVEHANTDPVELSLNLHTTLINKCIEVTWINNIHYTLLHPISDFVYTLNLDAL